MPEEPNDELWQEREQANLCVYCGEFEEVYNGICGNCFAEFARRAGQSTIPPDDGHSNIAASGHGSGFPSKK